MKYRLGWVAMIVAAVFAGCWPAAPKQPKITGPRGQSPATARSAPGQSPSTPLGAPGQSPSTGRVLPVDEAPAAPPTIATDATGKPLDFGNAVLAKIRIGMTRDELTQLLTVPGEPLSETAEGGSAPLLRWTDARGNILMARFEKDRLARKSLMFRSTPDEPLPAEEAQPEAASGDAAPPGDAAKPAAPLDARGRYALVKPGMTLDEAAAAFEATPTLLAKGAKGVMMYRFGDKSGASFTARFDGDKLSRKTPLQQRGESAPVEQSEPAEQEVEPAQPAPAQEETPTPAAVEQTPAAPEEAPAEEAPARDPRVRVAKRVPQVDPESGEVIEPTTPNRERRHNARLPKFAHGFRDGDYEVRIVNISLGKITAALIEEDRGQSFTLPRGGSRAIKVGRGTYTLYYVNESDPRTLRQAAGISIDGAFFTDLLINVGEKSVDIDTLANPSNVRQ